MSESAIADFVTSAVADTAAVAEPVETRVVLSQRRLVFATGEDTTTVPLSAVFDVSVGHVPPAVQEFFDDAVSVGYTREDAQRAAIIEADTETVDRFANLLFRAVLSGTAVEVIHPAKVGGRVTDATARSATLRLPTDAVAFEGLDQRPSIDLDAVVHFERGSHDGDGVSLPVLRIRHTADGRAVTTEMALDSSRKMNILGRYLRLEYGDRKAAADDIDLAHDEAQALVALDAAGENPNLAGMLGRDDRAVRALLGGLEEKGLVTANGADPELTPTGRVVVGEYIEDVNV
jgi:helix-turn-helix protein